MAVSKRVRFEVLRRDEHTCQYCGSRAPDVVLHVDHVMPVALGGDDKPNNLVAACSSCNSGKASIAPGSPLVEAVGDRAAAYALGMVDKMTRMRATLQAGEDYYSEFLDHWNGYQTTDGRAVALPGDSEMSIQRWYEMGAPLRLLTMAVDSAMSMKRLYGRDAEFSYMAGIVWNKLEALDITTNLTQATAAVYTEYEKDDLVAEAHRIGWRDGYTAGLAKGGA